MKTLNKLIILLSVVALIYSCGNTEAKKEAAVEVSAESMATVDYSIDGMVCAMGCAGTIEKEVVGMAGVIVSHVDYEAGKAHFEFDQSIVSENEIIAKIESIADGQYKVGEWVEKDNSDEELEFETEEESEGSEETVTEVSLPSFEIPNLFTLLMDQI